jgi:hypothetical protein
MPFHHDRGCFVFAVSPRRGEQAALGRPSGRDFVVMFINDFILFHAVNFLHHIKNI